MNQNKEVRKLPINQESNDSLENKIDKLILEIADLKTWVVRMVRKGKSF